MKGSQHAANVRLDLLRYRSPFPGPPGLGLEDQRARALHGKLELEVAERPSHERLPAHPQLRHAQYHSVGRAKSVSRRCAAPFVAARRPAQRQRLPGLCAPSQGALPCGADSFDSFSLGRHLSRNLEAEHSRVVLDAVRAPPPPASDRAELMLPDPADRLFVIVSGEVGAGLKGVRPREGHGRRVSRVG